jgi:hypothetical protein
MKSMIKKVLTISIVTLFLVATTGFSLSLHFCGSRLVSIAVNAKSKACCGDDSGRCCHSEIKIVQISDHYLACSQTIQSDNNVNPEPVYVSGIIVRMPVLNEKYSNSESPPPPKIQSALAARQTYLL